MLPFIVSMLAEKGLDLLSRAIDGGADKAKEFIEEKTGVILDKKDLKESDISKLQEFQEENKLDLEKLALENKKEDNRNNEEEFSIKVSDKINATILIGVSNLIGIAINNAYRERQSISEFLFGSSVGSKTKDKI